MEIKDIFIRKLVFPLLIVSFLSCLPDRLPALIQRFRPSKAAEQLHHEVRKLKQTPTVIFLEDSVVTKFVPWNDPFLRNSVILAHDLRSQNTELGKSFPNYRWLQARILRSYEEFALKLNLVSGDQFQYEPEGYSSMFQLASAVIETSKHPQRDIFDWNPEGILSSGENNLSYLENSAREAMRKGGYRKDIHLGLIHLARLLLLPQSSRQNPGEFPIAEFRKQFEAAEALFRSAGETGKVLAAELLKVQRRIDQDSDDHLSDEEIRNYFLRKSLYWKIQKRGVPREELCYE